MLSALMKTARKAAEFWIHENVSPKWDRKLLKKRSMDKQDYRKKQRLPFELDG